MSDKLFESISALMDNEVDDLELRRLLKEMETNDELAQVWSRYHVARAVLHKELPANASTKNIDLTARVRAALQEEKSHRERTFMDLLPRTAAVAATVMFSILLTAKLVVNQPSNGGINNNAMAVAQPAAANSGVQRASYIIGQPSSAAPSLHAQRLLQQNDVQRVEHVNMQNGYIVLPVVEVQSTNPAQ